MKRLSLFWKVYLGFLLALFLPLLINEVIFTLEKDRREPPPHRNIDRLVEWAAAHLAREAGDLLERGETAGLSALLAQAGAMSGAEFSVVRRGGSGPSSGPDEPPARDVVSVIAPFVVSGDAYHLSARFFPFRGKPPFPPRHPWMLLIPMGVGAILCFVLVRHIVAPILGLREATLRLGQGNLAARAGGSVTGRGDEIADLGKAFDRMAERIEELITSQRRLMGDISHELRSPLQRLDVALTLARKGCSPEAAGFLDRADREAGRMGDMVGQILKLTEAELNPPDTLQSVVDIPALLADVAEDARFEGGREGKGIALGAIPDTPGIRGDENALRSAVENVVRNALRATPPGTSVEIGAERKPERIVISVRDHGPGLPEGELTRIFRPFYRVDAARDRESGGVGLGLAIAERAVRCHGGTIAARNASEGLLVEIALPVGGAFASSPDPDRARERAGTRADAARP